MLIKSTAILFASLLLAAPQAFADAAEPVCLGKSVDASLFGRYVMDGHPVQISAHSVQIIGEGSAKAWTCKKNGILMLVTQFGKAKNDDNFESRAIAVSGDVVIDFGEVVGNTINAYDAGQEAPLSQKGLAKVMAAGNATVYSRK